MEKNRDSSIGRIPPLPGSVSSHSLVGSTSPGEKESSEGLGSQDGGYSAPVLQAFDLGEKVEPVYSKVVKRKKKQLSPKQPQVGVEETEGASEVQDSELHKRSSGPVPEDDHYSPPPVPRYNPTPNEEESNIYEEIEGISSTATEPQVQPNPVLPPGIHPARRAIHYAAASGDKKLLKDILMQLPPVQCSESQGDTRPPVREGVDERDGDGRTALMHAVYNNHTHCVKLLVKHGAVVNSEAKDGSTALHHSAYSGSAEMLALLLSLGANGTAKDKDGRTPLHWCANNPDPEAMKTLLDKVPDLDVDETDVALITPLMWSAFYCRVHNIQLLKDFGANQSLRDVDGMTALHWSVQRHDTHAVQALLDFEASTVSDIKGKMVMHKAAEQGCARAIALIHAVRPDSIDDTDKDGRTPLHWATVCENTEAIKILLEFRADPEVRDCKNQTPLDYAREKKLHYCSLLLQSRVEPLHTPDTSLCTATEHGEPGRSFSEMQEYAGHSCNVYQSVLTSKQYSHMRVVCGGAWMHKFTNRGKGPLHTRFFWVEPKDKLICWTKVDNKLSQDTKREIVVGVHSSASPAVVRRRDFDPLHQHKYTFTILTTKRVLDVVAVSSEDYKIWIQGLKIVLETTGVNINNETHYS